MSLDDNDDDEAECTTTVVKTFARKGYADDNIADGNTISSLSLSLSIDLTVSLLYSSGQQRLNVFYGLITGHRRQEQKEREREREEEAGWNDAY